MHSQTILFSIFIDDMRVLNKDKDLCAIETKFCQKILNWAGWNINMKKSSFEPTQQLLYLGFYTDTVNMMYFSPLNKLLVIKDLLVAALKKENILKTELAKILGKIASRKKSHGNIVQVMTRHTQHILGKAVHIHEDQDWTGFVTLDDHARLELQYFLDNIVEFNGKKIQTSRSPLHIIHPYEQVYFTEEEHFKINQNEMHICSDASDTHSYLYEMDKFTFVHEFKFIEEESNASSGYRELLSVIKFIESYQKDKFTNQTVIYWLTDSQNLYSFLKKGSRKLYIQKEILKVKKFEADMGVIIIPVWTFRDDENIKLADLGSKFEKSTDEWSIDPQTYIDICNYFQAKPTVDCFATTLNRKCKRFFSKIPQEGSLGVNYFTQSLNSDEIYWACPPPQFIIDLFKHIVSYPCNITVIIFVPVWKSANFWPYIVKQKVFHPIIQRFKICKPSFVQYNKSKNVFSGMKNFQSLALLTRSAGKFNVHCPI